MSPTLGIKSLKFQVLLEFCVQFYLMKWKAFLTHKLFLMDEVLLSLRHHLKEMEGKEQNPRLALPGLQEEMELEDELISLLFGWKSFISFLLLILIQRTKDSLGSCSLLAYFYYKFYVVILRPFWIFATHEVSDCLILGEKSFHFFLLMIDELAAFGHVGTWSCSIFIFMKLFPMFPKHWGVTWPQCPT